MKIISNSTNNASLWAQPGILMSRLLEKLEKHQLGFLANPAAGDITLGGALAIGAHGTGVPAKDENLSLGHTHGSLSNLIMGLTAVVFNETAGEFILKQFSRSDPEMTGLLVHLGRTFITNFTIRAGPLQYLRCKSYIDIPAEELFSKPDNSPTTASKKPRTIEHFLNVAGRIEVVLFPFTNKPWLKVWEVLNFQPNGTRKVTKPFNYGFSRSIPKQISNTVGFIKKQFNLVTMLGPAMQQWITHSLILEKTLDIWGTSRTVLQYVRPNTLRMTTNGYAILTKRANVQNVIHDTYRIYIEKTNNFAKKGLFPINGPIGIRVTGTDNPEDVIMEGAQVSGIASSSPAKRFKEFDTVVWIDILSFPGTKDLVLFMSEIEQDFYKIFKHNYALMRVEWSKGWAYNATAGNAWADKNVMFSNILPDLRDWGTVRKTLNELDPNHIFSSDLLKTLFAMEPESY